ncbi:MAG: hypothetical protein CBC04_01925 [Verrucomicrobia bacterium TMED44]|nr:MAG: hypothetical protein CBC04_01925 [Verrucomicrobia bacterium TMED44]
MVFDRGKLNSFRPKATFTLTLINGLLPSKVMGCISGFIFQKYRLSKDLKRIESEAPAMNDKHDLNENISFHSH